LDLSFNDRQRLVTAAIQEARGSTDCYVVELYDDHAVYECYGDGADAGKSFDVPFTIDADQDVALGDRTEVVRETTYRAVKFVGKDTIEGLAIPFGGTFAGKDLHGETFDVKTDLCIDWFGESGRPLLYDHGLDGSMKASVVGRQIEFETRAEGVWAQSQLDMSAKYRKAVDKLIEAQALGYSSGAMPHLATKNSKGVITRWPWVELSLTPMPAEPSTLGVHYTKSAAEALAFLEAVDLDIPAPLKAALSALDEWAEARDDESLPAGLKFAEHADRLLADVEAFRTRTGSLADLRAKSGRVLSAATRERLLRHPASLRELADDLDGLLTDADAEKAAKKVDAGLLQDVAETLRRAALIDHPEGVLH
jgi:hypothetical protein